MLSLSSLFAPPKVIAMLRLWKIEDSFLLSSEEFLSLNTHTHIWQSAKCKRNLPAPSRDVQISLFKIND